MDRDFFGNTFFGRRIGSLVDHATVEDINIQGSEPWMLIFIRLTRLFLQITPIILFSDYSTVLTLKNIMVLDIRLICENNYGSFLHWIQYYVWRDFVMP